MKMKELMKLYLLIIHLEKIMKSTKQILLLKEYNFSNITFLTHDFINNISHIERFKLAKNYLDKYTRAN